MGNRGSRGSQFVQDFHRVPADRHLLNLNEEKITKNTDSSLCTLFFEVTRAAGVFNVLQFLFYFDLSAAFFLSSIPFLPPSFLSHLRSVLL
jgi:hypothetical protein